MAEPQERLDRIVQRLRAQGYRLTPQRMAIVRMIVHSHSHPTAEDIYNQVSVEFPMLSLATVYKTLNVLKSLGEVAKLEIDGCSHYDSEVTTHPHLICLRCCSITDLPPETMDKAPQEILAGTGFQALRWEIKIYGLCSQCQEQGKA